MDLSTHAKIAKNCDRIDRSLGENQRLCHIHTVLHRETGYDAGSQLGQHVPVSGTEERVKRRKHKGREKGTKRQAEDR